MFLFFLILSLSLLSRPELSTDGQLTDTSCLPSCSLLCWTCPPALCYVVLCDLTCAIWRSNKHDRFTNPQDVCVWTGPRPLCCSTKGYVHTAAQVPFFFCSWSFTLGVWTFNLHQPPVERSTSHTVFKWLWMTHTSVCLAIFHWSISGKFDGFVVIFAESPLSLQMGLLQTPNFLITPLSTEDILHFHLAQSLVFMTFFWTWTGSDSVTSGSHYDEKTRFVPFFFFIYLQCERSLGDLVYQIWTFTFKMTVLSSSDRVFPFEVPGATGLDPVTA